MVTGREILSGKSNEMLSNFEYFYMYEALGLGQITPWGGGAST